jgi:signal transduction histidine kinase
MKLHFVLSICFIWGLGIVFPIQLFAQVNMAEITGAYIYNFAKLSSSQKLEQQTTYNIVLISEQEEIIQEFIRIEKKLKVNNKPIKVSTSSTGYFDFGSANLVFITSDKLNYYTQVFEQSKNHEVLIVSENYHEKREIMLNLYSSDDGKIMFEMNKGNIYERKINISDEVLLLGGTEIDLIQMYLDLQSKLDSSEFMYRKMVSSLDSLNDQVLIAKGIIESYEGSVNELSALIKLQNIEKHKLTDEIQNYKLLAQNQARILSENESKLEYVNDSLLTVQQDIIELENKIRINNSYLDKQNVKIVEKEKILSEKNMVIQKQKIIVIYFIIGTTIVLILLLLLLKSTNDKKKKNKLLEIQKKAIYNKNSELEKNKKIILTKNEQLNDQNEELNASLESIKQMQNKLVQSEKMASLGVLSAGIAHEINNPINFVYAGINSLLRDFEDIEPVINEVSNIDIDNDDLKEKLIKIQKLKKDYYFDEAIEAIPEIINDIRIGADRTTEIVKGLRNFSRFDKKISEPLNVNEGLDTSLLLLKNRYKNHVEIIKDYGVDLPDLLCFPGKINQAFLNIISNAVDAIQESGKIWLKTRKINNEINISIKDSGTGIPDKILGKLFDPFFTTKPVGEGTGLGLSITYGIIKDHHGKIDVVSEPGSGSEFIITLPIV